MANRNPNDYGSPAPTNRAIRPLLLANYILHFISSVIVLGIGAYFIAQFNDDTHLRYWVGVAAADAIIFLAAMAIPMTKSYKGYYAPLDLIFSHLWLIAFVFAVQDYNYNGGPFANSPSGVRKSGLKRTIEAFTFISFFTSLVALIANARMWDAHRVRGGSASPAEKHRADHADPHRPDRPDAPVNV